MDKEELRQRLESSREDWRALEKTAKLRRRLQSSAEVWEAPATVGKLQGQRTSRESIAKASQRQHEEGTTVGRLGEL